MIDKKSSNIFVALEKKEDQSCIFYTNQLSYVFNVPSIRLQANHIVCYLGDLKICIDPLVVNRNRLSNRWKAANTVNQ